LLAYVLNEDGAERVEDALAAGAVIGTVNLAEVLTKLVDGGGNPDEVAEVVLGLPIQVDPFTTEAALLVARLRPVTVGAGLSLGDRACLALGLIRNAPVLTADRAWGHLGIGIEVVVIH
jgi:ribonuclease VapC